MEKRNHERQETETMGKKRPYRLISRRSCRIVANRYQQGLDEGRWTTQTGALETLRVSQAELSFALQLRALPAEVRDLFEDEIDVTSHTVRVIREVIMRDGLATVLQRIQRSGACGSKYTKKTVLGIVKGKISESKRALRWSGQDSKIAARSLDLPKSILDRYHLGITKGEWNTYSECARVLNVSRRHISDAVAIGQIPDAVRYLFWETDLTFAIGRRLLALKNELGADEMLVRARRVEPMFKVAGRTAENILTELRAEHIRPSNFFRVRIKKGRGPNRLVIECRDAELLLRYRREMELAIKKVLQKRIENADQIELVRELQGLVRTILPEMAPLPSTFDPRPA
ncbi:hypothetical protein [Caballeronia choica]|nr:hypothetical protein [Caballeronia choica]